MRQVIREWNPYCMNIRIKKVTLLAIGLLLIFVCKAMVHNDRAQVWYISGLE